MANYLRVLGLVLILGGIGGSVYCSKLAAADEPYFKALRALEKYPGNVLYTTEFRVAEPKHMILTAGVYAAAPLGLVLGSLSLGLAVAISRLDAK